ncbi:MAG TPA: HRDC domain-containing protein [Desulfobacterales bacterium]|nr:HRDC domain-containing protein [Desulfobacterales bacterium]
MEYHIKNDIRIIDNLPALEKTAKELEKEKIISFDLEADSMHHFQEKVCLIQIAAQQSVLLIDPLPIENLSALKPLFSDHKIKKIAHGADYDVRSLYRDFQIQINNLFDTQLACRFLGLEATGLDSVLGDRFNISLDKRYQKKDWSQRPLPKEMVEYAAKDVIYLAPLAKAIEKELEKMGRVGWLDEECEYLSKVRALSPNHQPLYLSFKGAGKLGRRSLAALETLLQFRKKVAGKKDKPLFKIFGNASLMQIAVALPVNIGKLSSLNALSQKQIHMYGNALTEMIKNVWKIPENDLPFYPHRKVPMPKPAVQKRINAIKTWRDARAKQLHMDPALLCNKELMSTIAAQNPFHEKDLEKIPKIKIWQKKAFGAEILEALKENK